MSHPLIEALGHDWILRWKSLQGLTHGADLYAEAVEAAPDGARFVELGVFTGAGLILLDSVAKHIGKKIELVGVDLWIPWTQPHTMESVRATLDAWGCEAELLLCDTVEASLQFQDQSCWFVYLDADHSHDSVLSECRAWAPKVADGGILCGDDWDIDAGVSSAVTVAFGHRCEVVPGDSSTRVWRANPRDLTG